MNKSDKYRKISVKVCECEEEGGSHPVGVSSECRDVSNLPLERTSNRENRLWSNPCGSLNEQPYGRPASSSIPLSNGKGARHVSGMTATTPPGLIQLNRLRVTQSYRVGETCLSPLPATTPANTHTHRARTQALRSIKTYTIENCFFISHYLLGFILFYIEILFKISYIYIYIYTYHNRFARCRRRDFF